MDLISSIRKGFEKPLPGEEAQLKMAHAYRRKLWPAPHSAKDAGVMLLLYPVEAVWHLVFIERSTRHVQDRHSGQISFPGGKKEPIDKDLVDCAFREAEEEVGVPRKGIEVLGSLTPLYVPVSDFLVHPVVTYCDFKPRFVPQVSEVASILEVPFDYFTQRNNVLQSDISLSNQMLIKDVPHFEIHGKVLWGATAMILSELLTLTGDWS